MDYGLCYYKHTFFLWAITIYLQPFLWIRNNYCQLYWNRNRDQFKIPVFSKLSLSYIMGPNLFWILPTLWFHDTFLQIMLKVSWFQNVLLLPSNLPNNQRNFLRISALASKKRSNQKSSVKVVHVSSGKNLISILVTYYIQKRRGQALLFSFEYNLLP